jgi:hypothetical protein
MDAATLEREIETWLLSLAPVMLVLNADTNVVGCAKAPTPARPFYDLIMGALPDASDRKMRFSGMSAIRLKAGKSSKRSVWPTGVTALNQLGFIHVPVWPA